MKLITTSWDDGHPKDFKLAELLAKYNLPATFYIPKTNPEHVVMEENAVVQLAQQFEIGGHTLNHVRLYSNLKDGLADTEISGCFRWLKDLLGEAPVSFCFPGGVVNNEAITAAYQAGFRVLRTTELLSTAFTSTHQLFPTTLQVFEHQRSAYLKNLLKRQQYKSLIWWLSMGSTTDLFKLIDLKLGDMADNGGCFHLWGHSWEIEAYNLWNKLEMIFKRIAGLNEFEYVSNKGLI